MFCKCAATKRIDMISRVKERGKQPYWIPDDFYKDLVSYWETDKAKENKKKLLRVECLIETGWNLINTSWLLSFVHKCQQLSLSCGLVIFLSFCYVF